MKDLESVLELIKSSVSLQDLLVSKGRIYGTSGEEQFSCMFHGVDQKKSCRYYRETDTAYCWVCKEKWDIISFTQKLEQVTFSQAINYLIRVHGIDTSKLPDAPEAAITRMTAKTEVKVDQRKLNLEKISDAIRVVREEVPGDTYDRFVYAYMILKYVIPEDKFQGSFEQVKGAMLRVLNKK